MKKKLLSIFLSLTMVITMMPAMTMTAFAAETSAQSAVVLVKATASGNNAVKLSWTKADTATKYVVYGNKCGKTMKKLATVKSNKYTVKKIGKTKLAAHKFYKFQVVAYNGSSKLATSKAIHFITGKTSGKYSNATKITATTAALTLEVGQTAKVGATVKVYKNKKHVPSTHGSKLRYASDNNAVATVSSNGTVKAIAEGTTTIYIQDVGGLWCKTVITVKLDRYTVSFNANGHGTAPETMTVVKGEKVIKPADPTAGGYTFDGWFKEASCTNAWNFDTDTVTADTTLYAKWRYIPTPPPAPTTYTVTFNLNGATGTAPASQSIASGSKATKPDDPRFTDHTFAGWYKTKDATTGKLSDPWDFDTDTVTADMTLYAGWTTTIEKLVGEIPSSDSKDTAPENAWTATGSDGINKCYKAAENEKTKLFFYSPKNDANKTMGITVSTEVTKVGKDYTYSNDTIKFIMTDGKLSSIQFTSTNNNFTKYDGTYAPALAELTMQTGTSSDNWNEISIKIKGIDIASGKYYFAKTSVVDTADNLESLVEQNGTGLTTEDLGSVNSSGGLSIEKKPLVAETEYKIVLVVTNSAGYSQTIVATLTVGMAPPE